MFNNKIRNINKEINKNLFTYFRYAITTMISILIFRSSAIIDTIFTGHYISATGLAAMGLILPIDTFCLAIIQSLTSGSIVVMGGYLGERNFGKANALFTKSSITLFAIMSFLSLIILLFTENLIMFLGGNEILLADCTTYLRVYALFLIFKAFEHFLSACVRLTGRTTIPPIFSFINTIINFALKYIFVIKLGLGIAGIAYSTAIALLIVSFMYLICILTDKEKRLGFTLILGSFKEIFYIAYNGISSFAILVSVSIFAIIANKIIIQHLTIDGLSAVAPINMMMYINYSFISVFMTSMVPLVSINYGRKYFHNVKLFLKYTINGGLIFSSILFILSATIPTKIVDIFLDKNIGANITDTALYGLNIVKYQFILILFAMILNEFLTSIQRPLESLLLSLLTALISPISSILILSKLFGTFGIFLSFPVASFISSSVSGYVFYSNRIKYLSNQDMRNRKFYKY